MVNAGLIAYVHNAIRLAENSGVANVSHLRGRRFVCTEKHVSFDRFVKSKSVTADNEAQVTRDCVVIGAVMPQAVKPDQDVAISGCPYPEVDLIIGLVPATLLRITRFRQGKRIDALRQPVVEVRRDPRKSLSSDQMPSFTAVTPSAFLASHDIKPVIFVKRGLLNEVIQPLSRPHYFPIQAIATDRRSNGAPLRTGPLVVEVNQLVTPVWVRIFLILDQGGAKEQCSRK